MHHTPQSIMWAVIGGVGIGGHLLLVYLTTHDIVATVNASIAVSIAYILGKRTGTNQPEPPSNPPQD